jgi:hypothetical protein
MASARRVAGGIEKLFYTKVAKGAKNGIFIFVTFAFLV